jgi:hypothetical protein
LYILSDSSYLFLLNSIVWDVKPCSLVKTLTKFRSNVPAPCTRSTALFWTWRWRPHFTVQCQQTSTRLHGVASQNAAVFIITAAIT